MLHVPCIDLCVTCVFYLLSSATVSCTDRASVEGECKDNLDDEGFQIFIGNVTSQIHEISGKTLNLDICSEFWRNFKEILGKYQIWGVGEGGNQWGIKG